MYDPTYMNYLEWAKAQRQKVAQRLPETEGEGVMESYCLMGIESQFCKMKRVLKTDGGEVCLV